MLAERFGRLIRAERLGKGLSQAALARAAGVSRTVVSRLEQCRSQPVQTDVLDRLLRALEMDAPATGDEAHAGARRLARLEHRRRLDERRDRHLRLAVRLAAGGRDAAALVEKARARVALWRRRNTCSPLYIRRWSALLDLPPRELAHAMISLGDWEDALFQNSPWSWAWS